MAGRKPTHTLRMIPQDPNGPWEFVGAAWENKDGSLSLTLDKPLPQGARLFVKRRKDASAAAEAPSA